MIAVPVQLFLERANTISGLSLFRLMHLRSMLQATPCTNKMQNTNIEKFSFFGIVLDGPGVYSCGEYVNGHVVVEVYGEETTNTSVEVQLIGKGNVHWREIIYVIECITLTSIKLSILNI